MADYAWPDALPPQTMVWSIQKAGVQFRSPYAGSVESITFPGWFWRVSITLKPRRSKGATAGQARAFFDGLAGGDHAVLLYDWLRPVPRGTLRLTPDVWVAMVRGDQTIAIQTQQTLLAGDLFKIGNTVYECFADCAPVAGVLTVPVTGRVRAPAVIGTPVLWDRPTIRCIMPAMSNASAFRPGVFEGTAIDLEEAA